MKDNSFNEKYGGGQGGQAKMLSGVGAVLYSVASTVLFMLGTLCMRTDGEQALSCFLIPVLFIAGSYLAVALLVQGRMPLFIAAAASSVLCGYVLSANILHSLMCLCAFAGAFAVYTATKKKSFGFVGNICLSAVFYALTFLLTLGVLLYEKYSEIGMDTLLRAYDSFCEVLCSEPRAVLEEMKQIEGESAEQLAESYSQMISTLEQMLELMVYTVPSMLVSVCVIGGFFTVAAVKRHRRMLELPDTVGAFEITVFSAVFFVATKLVVIFIDPITPVGITLITVLAPLELGLAVSGVLFGVAWLKKNNKGKLYYLIAAALLVLMPSYAVSILAFLGAYSTVLVYRFRRMIEKAVRGSMHGGNKDDDKNDDNDDENM